MYAKRYAGYREIYRAEATAAGRESGLEQLQRLSGLAGAFLMTEKRKFQAIKGTRDLLPPETELWNQVEQTAREVFGTYGFGEIRPPIFEPTELFARAVGGETDIVSKEMYVFRGPWLD